MKKLNLENSNQRDILGAQLWELDISFDKSIFSNCLDQLNQELENKNLLVRPKVWLSDDWFCPDSISGIAIPFTLMHPRLIALERQYIGHVEGETHDWFMKLMRHECGHVMDNAYFLKDEQRRKSIFGDHDKRYPNSYTPKVFSKNYVYHLEDHYAQAHPEEDFAETFATWLTPRSNWRNIYENWPALTKLKYVDSQMKSLRGKKPNVVCYKEVDSIEESTLTVAEYLQLKKKRLRKQSLTRRSLKHIESYLNDNSTTGTDLRVVLKNNRQKLIRNIALKTNTYQYKIDSVVKDLENITSVKKLYIPNERGTQNLEKLLLSHTKKFFTEGRDRIIM
ncbi:putative zinc-binding metallopeptidase [Halobacteriovorax sp.]|uniref:putative zinc-binding metallopeptidase n=1 Tax=Halobacteriovorax sp. TaxID=2020862 RepID=UPI003AF1F989